MSAIYTPLKLLTILASAPLVFFGLSAVVGSFTENMWAKAGIAIVAMFALPLFIADRMIPDDDPQKGSGLPTDALSLVWLLFVVLFFGLGISFTRPMVMSEVSALSDHGFANSARVGHWIAGDAPKAPSTVPAVGETPDAGPADATNDAGPPDTAPAPEVAEEGQELAPDVIFERWAPSVVSIQFAAGPGGAGGGTGFVVNDDGLIATNHHVVAGSIPREGASGTISLHVKLKSGSFAPEVWLIDHDEERDLALLRIVGAALPAPTQLADADAIRVGQRAISIGNPLGLEHTLTDGLVSSRRVYQGKRYIQMSVPVSPGNSGGPLFDLRGRVIGVTTAQIGSGFSRAQNLNLAVPADDLQALIDKEHPEAVRVGGGPMNGTGAW